MHIGAALYQMHAGVTNCIAFDMLTNMIWLTNKLINWHWQAVMTMMITMTTTMVVTSIMMMMIPVQTNIYLYKNCEYNDNKNRRLKQVFVLYGFAFQ